MSLFGKIVRTAINVGVGVPVAIVKDVFTLGGSATWDGRGDGPTPYIAKQMEKIKDEAED